MQTGHNEIISNMGLAELKALQNAVVARIEEVQKAAKAEILGQVRQLVEKHGLTNDDLFPAVRERANKGKKVAPKFRDPLTGNTWSGRGKAPLWIADKDRAQYAI